MPLDVIPGHHNFSSLLKEPVERLKGSVRALNPKFKEFIQGLDTDSEGNTGNILAYGKISGTFTG